MLKWIGGSVAGVLIVGLLLFGGKFFGYGQTAVDEVRKAADDAVPMDFKVADVERMVRDLEPEIKKYMEAVAKQQVDVEILETTVAKREADLTKQKGQILALKSELDRGEKEYVFEGQNYTADEVRSDLDRKFNSFKSVSSTLAREKELLKARHDALKANEGRLAEMVTAKKDLEQQVAFLKTRVETNKAEEAVGALPMDNSKMARATKVIAELNKKLDVDEKVRIAEGRMNSEIRAPEKKEIRDVSKEIESFFGDEAKAKQEL